MYEGVILIDLGLAKGLLEKGFDFMNLIATEVNKRRDIELGAKRVKVEMSDELFELMGVSRDVRDRVRREIKERGIRDDGYCRD